MNASANLTKNQAMVFQVLSDASLPLTAYTILDDLRDQGFRAPPQVYRALEKLQEMGLVHRLDSLNAFVACRHSDCHAHDFIAFAICDDCGQVIEIAQKSLEDEILSLTETQKFMAKKTSVEIRGICHSCRALTSNAQL